MDYVDLFHPTQPNEEHPHNDTKQLEDIKSVDVGYNKIWRKVLNSKNQLKRTKVNFYTSGGVGNRIRNAVTGEYYNDIVGTVDEDLYYKVGLSTGECSSKNGSTTLFYTSPQEFMKHNSTDLTAEQVARWETRRNERLLQIK